MNKRYQVCAVVILYNPIWEILESNLLNIKNQVDHIVLVDNSSISTKKLPFNTLEDDYSYLYNANINGIAGAQNKGITKALVEAYDFVVLFDQDSAPEFDLIEQLIRDYDRLHTAGIRIAAIGPQVINAQNNKPFTPRFKQRQQFPGFSSIIQETQLISSGSLIPLSAIKEIGLMEEKLFIDGVDTEWCWRARSLGFEIAMSLNAKMVHMLGEGDIRFFGIKVAVSSSFRLYYLYRNYLFFLRRSYVPIYWKVNNAVKNGAKILLYGAFLPSRGENLRQIFRGVKDGLRQ